MRCGNIGTKIRCSVMSRQSQALQIFSGVRRGAAVERDSFDLVVSSGVLHHTPDTMRAFRESFRVLKPEGRARIALYRKAVLHHSLAFPVTRFAMRMVSLKHPGADSCGD
jgi:SAM-dependent methyltransferase